METMNYQHHSNSCDFVSRKRQAAFASVQDNEVKRLCRLNKENGSQAQWISENVTNCEREHMVCDVSPVNEVAAMETSDLSSMPTPHTNRANTAESSSTLFQSQQFASHQPLTLPLSHFMGQLGTQRASQQTSCSRCRAGQPGHIHHICSF